MMLRMKSIKPEFSLFLSFLEDFACSDFEPE